MRCRSFILRSSACYWRIKSHKERLKRLDRISLEKRARGERFSHFLKGRPMEEGSDLFSAAPEGKIRSKGLRLQEGRAGKSTQEGDQDEEGAGASSQQRKAEESGSFPLRKETMECRWGL